jgi:sporadic carbohydrate cluster protein (TIGR04323 family)
MSEGGGYRGYIVSRPVRGSHFPQRVQNLVVRDYAARRNLPFRLSVTEYAMPGCTMMFESLLDELDALDGIVLFSLFTLPSRRATRRRAYQRVLAAGKSLHAALEQLVIRTSDAIDSWEDIINVDAVLPATPFGGRYEKTEHPLGSGTALQAAMTLEAVARRPG